MKLIVLALVFTVVACSDSWREGTPDARCQAEDTVGTKPVILPNDSDCASFYICSRGSRCELHLHLLSGRNLSNVRRSIPMRRWPSFWPVNQCLQLDSRRYVLNNFPCETSMTFNSIKLPASEHRSVGIQSKADVSSACIDACRQDFILSARYENKTKMFFPFRSIILGYPQSPWLIVILKSYRIAVKYTIGENFDDIKSWNFLLQPFFWEQPPASLGKWWSFWFSLFCSPSPSAQRIGVKELLMLDAHPETCRTLPSRSFPTKKTAECSTSALMDWDVSNCRTYFEINCWQFISSPLRLPCKFDIQSGNSNLRSCYQPSLLNFDDLTEEFSVFVHFLTPVE